MIFYIKYLYFNAITNTREMKTNFYENNYHILFLFKVKLIKDFIFLF